MSDRKRPSEFEFLGRLWRQYSYSDAYPHEHVRAAYKSGTLHIVERQIATDKWRVSFYCDRGSVPNMCRTAKSPSDARRGIQVVLKRCGRLADA